MLKYLIHENCCQINKEAADKAGYDMVTTKTVFQCLGGCLVVPDHQAHLVEGYKLVDELPEQFKEELND